MKFEQWLSENPERIDEMPIRTFQQIPEPNPDDPKNAWSPTSRRKYGWDKVDAALLASKSGVEKFKRLWANNDHDFDIYLLRTPEGHKYVEVGEITPGKYPLGGMDPLDWIAKIAGQRIEPAEDTITIIYTNNRGAEKVPFTGWTAAHRFGHALDKSPDVSEWAVFKRELRRDMEALLKDVYSQIPRYTEPYSKTYDKSTEKALKGVAQNIGTMRSARQQNIRTLVEFPLELLAQYLTTKNRIEFKVPTEKLIASYVFGRPIGRLPNLGNDAEKAEMNERLMNMAGQYNDMLYDIMGQCLNRVFVM